MAAIVLVLLVLAAGSRIATESAPALVVHRTVAAYVRLSGSSPALAWPRAGQAAVEVAGLGSFGGSGVPRPVPIASLAKMMTAYLTLRAHPLAVGQEGFVMRVSPAEVVEEEQRADLGQSTLPVSVGERISERRALEALMVASANNIAAMLAVHDAGGLSPFVARMNAMARMLGMSSTTYTDPSGFEPSTLSTAADQLKLARAATGDPAFAAIVDEPAASLPLAGLVANYDALIGTDGYVGVKTGSDGAAGGCLAFAKRVTIGGRRLTVLGVVVGQREGPLIDAALASARRLGDSAAAALRLETVLPAGASVLSASSANGRRTTAVTLRALREVGWAGLAVPVQVAVRRAVSRLRAGQQLATVTVPGAMPATTAAVAVRSLGGLSLAWRLQHLL